MEYTEMFEKEEKEMKMVGVGATLIGAGLEIAALFSKKKEDKGALSIFGLIVGGAGFGLSLAAGRLAKYDANTALALGAVEPDKVPLESA